MSLVNFLAMVSGNGICCIVAAFLILTLPTRWLLSAVTAAMVHELSHIAAVYLVQGKIRGIHLHLTGCEILTRPMGQIQSVFCILAGPAGSLLLLLLRKQFPLIAVCALLQGIYNLLPVLPLDGGRALCCLLHRCSPQVKRKIMTVSGAVIGTAGILAGVYLSSRMQWNSIPVIWSVLLNIRLLPRKIPCKDNGIGLQ